MTWSLPPTERAGSAGHRRLYSPGRRAAKGSCVRDLSFPEPGNKVFACRVSEGTCGSKGRGGERNTAFDLCKPNEPEAPYVARVPHDRRGQLEPGPAHGRG